MQVLECPIADVSAADLGLLLGGPLPEILTSLTIAGAGGWELQLGIIGASHVASVSHGGELTFREEISCNCAEPLPSRHEECGYGVRVDIAKRCNFPAELEQVSGPEWLAAQFPGQGEFHVTAVRGQWDAGAFIWETVHMYPEEDTIVRTTSTWEAR